MSTATVRVKALATASLAAALVLGLAIGYVVSDTTRSDMPMQGMSGMDMGSMTEDMNEMSTHMEDMDMGSMMGPAPKNSKDMPAMHGHD